MNYKLAHFLEWFLVNEHSLTHLNTLKPEKQLFWLGWLQWHIDFYLPGSAFVVCHFPKEKRWTLYLIGIQPYQGKQVRSTAKPKRFRIIFSTTPTPEISLKEFENQIIFDAELGQIDNPSQDRVKFLQIDLEKILLYAAYSHANTALALADELFENLKADFLSQTYVQLPRLTIDANSMAKLIEFDHYIDLLNARNNGLSKNED